MSLNHLPPSVLEPFNPDLLDLEQPFGSVKWIISDFRKFSLWHATYNIRRPTRIKITVDKEYLGFFFGLKSDLQYHIKGFDPSVLLEHQYDIFYVPDLQMEYPFEAQTYIACRLNFKTSFFKTWSKLFNSLNDFLSSIQAGKPSRMQNVPRGITPRISASLSNILHYSYFGQLRKKHLDIKATELTFHILQSITSTNEHFKIMFCG